MAFNVAHYELNLQIISATIIGSFITTDLSLQQNINTLRMKVLFKVFICYSHGIKFKTQWDIIRLKTVSEYKLLNMIGYSV